MPKITFYVKDDDLEIFEKAKRINEDSLSSILARALKDYLEREEARARGMEEVDLLVGPRGKRKARFFGRPLAVYPAKPFDRGLYEEEEDRCEYLRYGCPPEDWVDFLPDPEYYYEDEWLDNIENNEAIRAYQTQKNKILLYIVTPSFEYDELGDILGPSGGFDYSYEVYNSYEEMIQKTSLPEELKEDIAEELGDEAVEYIDV